MKQLKVVDQNIFGNIALSIFKDNEEYFLTRTQIGEALGYKNPRKAIFKIHEAHKDRLDKFSTVSITETVEDGRKVKREMVLYSAKGVYEICRWSKQTKANEFYDFVYDLLEALRKHELKLIRMHNDPMWLEERKTNKLLTKETMSVVDAWSRELMQEHPDSGLLHWNVYGTVNKEIRKVLKLPKNISRDDLDLRTLKLCDSYNFVAQDALSDTALDSRERWDVLRTNLSQAQSLMGNTKFPVTASFITTKAVMRV